MKVGFIGLGIMGSRMATNLLKSGNELVVYNRTREKASSLEKAGAVWADQPASVAKQVDIIFTMLATPKAVREVALGSQGFLDSMKPGSLWVDCSTVNPSFSQKMATEAQQRQVHFMDAPVAGSRGPAEKGQLLFLVGGDASDLEKARPLLEVMGQKITHAGGVSMGSSLKLVFNLLLALSMLTFSEALVLGESLGLTRSMLFDALQGAAAVAPAAYGKRQKIEAGDYSADFPLQWMQKDLELISVSAYEKGASLPLSGLAKEVYALAMRYGLAGDDFSAVYRFLSEKKNGR